MLGLIGLGPPMLICGIGAVTEKEACSCLISAMIKSRLLRA